jgi:T5SS/PEP-CTERM-associated repeat protein
MNGSIAVAGGTTVGGSAAAAWTIDDGGTVTTGGAARIAASADAGGSGVSVIGANSTWQVVGSLDVGDVGEGSLSVASLGTVDTAGVDVGVAAGAVGAVSIDDASSNLLDTGQLILGDAGTGELSITNAATVTAANADLGLQASGSGNVDIEGQGSTFMVTDTLNIGDGGVGVLTVGPGATLDVAGNLNEGAYGVLNIVGGVVDPASGILGGEDPIGNGGSLVYTGTLDLTGAVIVAGGTGELDVGAITGPGALEIGAGGNFILADGNGGDSSTAVIGSDAPTIAFAGNAGTLTVKDAPLLGTLEITSFATGDLIDLPNLGFASAFVGAPGTVELLNAHGAVVGSVLYGAAVSGSLLAAGISGHPDGGVPWR